jgi:putative transposase
MLASVDFEDTTLIAGGGEPRRFAARPHPPDQIHFNNTTALQGPLEPGQYTSIDYTQTLADHGLLASVGSVGDAYDNSLAESFVDSFKTELISDRVWRTRSQLELAVVEYVGWFNHDRLHEALGDLPPTEFEALYAAQDMAITTSIKIKETN